MRRKDMNGDRIKTKDTEIDRGSYQFHVGVIVPEFLFVLFASLTVSLLS